MDNHPHRESSPRLRLEVHGLDTIPEVHLLLQ